MLNGKELRKIRFEHNLTQKEMAERLSITDPYLSQMETGARRISEKLLYRIRKEFLSDL
ncbi:helix-turn-helix transcriptional regulator [Halobacillus sp. GSS1]|uniref:helix-turn-helix domain-containing protein n=1 Tax=Halobacillus sp. GSS1 TaxID=2815919 RepID=UPI001A8F6653|nr:helix-turn-helix transcriptional regulator [Halobacillus sp. GSS1]MBN9655984.1 helix-turn-helix transcriptional regulator [Halobacillus sp. GSS1]